MIFKSHKKPADPVKRFRSAGFLVALAVLFFSVRVHADTGILDNIAQTYKTAATGWTGALLGYANRLFMLLATIELAWSFAVWALDKNEFQSFISAVAKKIMWIGIFYALLLNGPVWIPLIIDSFVGAGSAAGGSGGLSPSEVFTTGLDNAATMLEGIKNMSLWDDFASIVIAGLSAIVIVLAFAVIAGQLLVALVESYIAISAGLLFLGFGGSRWTTDFVQKFIGYAVATGVKLFMLYLIIGIGNTQAQTWKAMLATIGTPGVPVFNIILTVLGGSVLLMFMAIQIPAMAASMLAGSPTLTAGAAAATAGMVGAGIVGAGAAGAASTLSAAKSAGGVASAAKAAWGEAGAQGATGLGRAVATLGNMGTSAARDTSNRMADAIAPTKGGRMADISTARTAEMSAANSPATPPAPPAPAQPAAPAAEGAAPAGGSSSASSAAGEGAAAPASAGGSAAATVAAPAGAGSAVSAPVAPTPTATASAAPTAPSGGSVTPSAPAAEVASPASLASATPAGGDFASMLDPKGASPGSTAAAPASAAPGSGSTAESVASVGAAADSALGSSAPASTGPAASTTPATPPSGVQEKAQAQTAQAPGFEDRFRDLQQVRPPQLPSDAAAPATVSIKFDAQHD
ncbi:P-type conjugative transfer protein TrbL [uncultured Variovorax sp.]|uniref:P-type conjugative transfer protein TrbL n=1 Tax=uncultured Variovorax sp. TaxID=114708 RepID=UPI002637F46E|nr:P-type conjugative transfer protein TrbL [uncultured Variovorax sp.]